MAYRNFALEDRRVCSLVDVNHGVVLHVGTVADANVVNVAPDGAVTPDRSFFSEVHVAYYLGTGFHIRGRVNLRVNPTERSNHDFRKIITQPPAGHGQAQ